MVEIEMFSNEFLFVISFQYSETCPHCTSKGRNSKLRYFYLSLDEAIYKCEYESCLFPFQNFLFKNLIDNSIYQYEEVFDEPREAYLKINLDGKHENEPQNPISTKIFCDNQRNPDIESYNCDFSDLFDDFDNESESKVKSQETDNPDFLDFLDETEFKTEDFNASEILDENGIDNFIKSILNDSPEKPTIKASPVKPTIETTQTLQKTNQTAAGSQPKLSKCLQHIEKVKNAKGRKEHQQRTKQSFAATIRQARKSQSKSQNAAIVMKQGGVNEHESQPKLPQKPNKMAEFFKSTSFIRPTELAQKLGSLKVDSEFLRQYMKAKEEKLFADELKADKIKPESSKYVRQTQIISTPKTSSIEISEKNEQKSLSTAKKKTIDKKSIEKDPLIDVKIESTEKKVRKPRVKKAKATDVKIEEGHSHPNASDSSVVKQESNICLKGKPVEETKRKSFQKNKKIKPNLTDSQKLDLPEEIVKKQRNRKRKSCEVSDKNDSIRTEVEKHSDTDEVPAHSKRQRKQKPCNELGNQKPKPKRQSSKSKMKSATMNMPLIHESPYHLNNDAGKLKV